MTFQGVGVQTPSPSGSAHGSIELRQNSEKQEMYYLSRGLLVWKDNGEYELQVHGLRGIILKLGLIVPEWNY